MYNNYIAYNTIGNEWQGNGINLYSFDTGFNTFIENKITNNRNGIRVAVSWPGYNNFTRNEISNNNQCSKFEISNGVSLTMVLVIEN